MRGSPWLVHFVHDLLQHLYILQVEIHTPHSNSRRDDKKFTFFESFYEVLLRWNIRYPDMQSFNVAKLVFCLSWPSHFLSEYGHLTLESFVFGHWTDAALNVWLNHKSCFIDWDSGATGDGECDQTEQRCRLQPAAGILSNIADPTPAKIHFCMQFIFCGGRICRLLWEFTYFGHLFFPDFHWSVY